MTDGDLVPLKCSRRALATLAAGLSRFGPSEGAPEWLISAVWLCTDDLEFVASNFTDVLEDGYVARTLSIATPETLAAEVEAELPDIEGRLMTRGCNVPLPGAGEPLSPPQSLSRWDSKAYSTTVLVRLAKRASVTHRTACALLFEGGGGSLLVGTDPSSLAMVLSEDLQLIARYRSECDEIPAAEAADLCAS